ncbi:MAG: four helix bundle protein [Desulfuromonadales bacterium GWD2_61_12]|nr:MAG: four helix bundle protein [Desulfuromonadales bacterium GWC2_61_20]OGR34541.1 MAG: four helix bundle protein [Desulfuromonadales bacterium GWD2_61_12]HAD03483.1 four helix bundle protein [Desulfuromonas sp.]
MSGNTPNKKLRPSGGYRTLRSFQTTTVIYDATVSFCARFIDKRSRLVDQMVQAARSGRQNIAEGSRAAATSSQTELRLVNVARASLDELLLDYEDFLRQRSKRQWTKDDAEAKAVREVGKKLGKDPTDRSDRAEPSDDAAYAAWLQHPDPAVVANTLICLIHQANYLLDQQIAGLERAFVNDGGYSEQLAAARVKRRRVFHPSDRADPTDEKQALPLCQLCSKPMVLRTAKQGENAGSQFLGCSGYPECKNTRPIDESA